MSNQNTVLQCMTCFQLQVRRNLGCVDAFVAKKQSCLQDSAHERPSGANRLCGSKSQRSLERMRWMAFTCLYLFFTSDTH